LLEFCWYFKTPKSIHFTIYIPISIWLKRPIISTRASICSFLCMPPSPRILKPYIQIIRSRKLMNMMNNISLCKFHLPSYNTSFEHITGSLMLTNGTNWQRGLSLSSQYSKSMSLWSLHENYIMQ